MIKTLLFALLFVSAADPAMAGPVVAALASAISAVTGIAAATVAVSLVQTAIGIGLSVISRVLLKPDAPKQAGITNETTTQGEKTPQSFIFGRTATAGQINCPPMVYQTDGNPNEWLVYVIELSDRPITGHGRFYLDGDVCEFTSSPTLASMLADPLNMGATVAGEYEHKVFVRLHTGAQTAADAYLLSTFASYPERPWLADMILRNVAYMVVTIKGRAADEVFQGGFPGVRFEVMGMPLYDPRTGTSVYTENPMIMAYNVVRGIPMANGDVWGYGIPDADIVQDKAIAAINACEQLVARPSGGTEPRYRAGLEVTVDQQPADILQTLLDSCHGNFADMGGEIVLSAGPPGPAVYAFTDDDVISTSPEDFKPFPGADRLHNGAHASYPDPDTWEVREALPLYNPALEALDGKRMVAQLRLAAVAFPAQVRRLMREMVADGRRFRNHSLALPPDATGVRVTDNVSWTSGQNGYTNKLFEVVQKTLDPYSDCVILQLRERDPSDYNPNVFLDGLLPPVVSPRPVIPPPIAIQGWAVEAIPGAVAIRISWHPETNAQALAWEVEAIANGVLVASGSEADMPRGSHVIVGLQPNTQYRVRGRLVLNRPGLWTGWTTVTTANIRPVIDPDDFDTDPPTKPPVVSLTSTTSTLTASWTAEGSDIAYSELEFIENGGNPIYAQTGANTHTVRGLVPGLQFTVRRRRVDRAGNPSVWSDPASHTVMADTVPPATPTGLAINAGFGSLWLRWNPNTELDLREYEVYMHTASTPAPVLATVATFRTTSNNFLVNDLADATTRHFWVRAVDTSGNKSGWTARAAGTTKAAVVPLITNAMLSGLIDATSFSTGVQPIRIWSGAALPTTYLVDLIAWGGKLYRWNGTAYVPDVLANNSIQTAHLDAGVVTTQKLAVGFGGNLIQNSAFAMGTVGWFKFGSGLSGNATNLNLQPPGQWAGTNFPTLVLAQTNADSPGYSEARYYGIKDNTGALGEGFPVKAGDWIEVSGKFSVHRAPAELRILWVLADGSTVLSDATTIPINAGSLTNPEEWLLTWTKAQAPATARYAIWVARKLATTAGQTSSYLFMHKPMMAITTAQRTEPTEYAPGSFTYIDGSGLITDSVTARIIDVADLTTHLATIDTAYIREANISGTLTAAILRGGTTLSNTIIVNGTALGTSTDRAADPAARVNAHTTLIDPGRLLVSGSRTIADWRRAGDLTKIDGGEVAANSLLANSAVIGVRGVQTNLIEFEHNKPAANRVSWTAGSIEYIDNDGNSATRNTTAGSTTTWVAGTTQYICWVQGATALTWTTDHNIARGSDRVILASYKGGHQLNATYGRTIIDGNGVKTDALLVTNNAQMGSATVNHLNINGFAVSKMIKSVKTRWPIGGGQFTNVLKMTANSSASDWTSNWLPLIVVGVKRLAGYQTELVVLLDHSAAGSWNSSKPNMSILQTRWQRKRSNQADTSYVNLNLMHSQSGEYGVSVTNTLEYTDPAPTSNDAGAYYSVYRLLGRKYNGSDRHNGMHPYIANVRCSLTHYKQGS